MPDNHRRRGGPGQIPPSGEDMPVRPRAAPGLHYGRACAVLLAAYLAFVAYGSLIPLDFRRVPMAEAVGRLLANPLDGGGRLSRSDLASNVMLYVPLSFLAMGASTRAGRRRAPATALAAVGVTALALCLSVTVELCQAFVPSRTPSAADVIAQSTGALVGVILWLLFGRRLSDWARAGWQDGAGGAAAPRILLGYAAVLLLCELAPFDLTLRPGEIWRKVKAGRIVAVPFTDPGGMASYPAVGKAAAMVPIGLLLAAVRRRGPVRLSPVFLGSALVAAAVEAAQLLVRTRHTSATDILAGGVGGTIGGLLAIWGQAPDRRLRDSADRPPAGRTAMALQLLLVLAWLAGLAWEKWRPLEFAWPEGGWRAAIGELLVVPLTRQYSLPWHSAVGQLLTELTTFAVLGMLVGAAAAGRDRWLRLATWPLVLLPAAVLEAGQAIIPSRTADPATIVIGAAGGALGLLFWRRCRGSAAVMRRRQPAPPG